MYSYPGEGSWPNTDNAIDGKASAASVKMELYPAWDFEACACKTLRLVSEIVRTVHYGELHGSANSENS